MTIEKIEVYRTKNGKLHNTLEHAKSHVVNNVCGVLDKVITKCVDRKNEEGIQPKGIYTRSDTFESVMLVAGDYDKVTKLVDDFNKAYEDIDIEDE